jgi:hypothetical protein
VLSVVVPVFDEAANLAAVDRELREELADRAPESEIL